MTKDNQDYGRHLNDLQSGLWATLRDIEETADSPERKQVCSTIEQIRNLLLAVRGDFADTENKVCKMKELIVGLKNDVDSVKEAYFLDHFNESYDERFEWLSKSYLSEDYRQQVLRGVLPDAPQFPSKNDISRVWAKMDREKRASVLACFKRPEIVIVPNFAAGKVLNDIVRFNRCGESPQEPEKADFPIVECNDEAVLNSVRELLKRCAMGPAFSVNIVDSAPKSLDLLDPCLSCNEKGEQLDLDILYPLYANYLAMHGLKHVDLLSYLFFAAGNKKEKSDRHGRIVLNSGIWPGKNFLIGTWDDNPGLSLDFTDGKNDLNNMVFRPSYWLM